MGVDIASGDAVESQHRHVEEVQAQASQEDSPPAVCVPSLLAHAQQFWRQRGKPVVEACCPAGVDSWSFSVPKVLGLLMNPSVISQESFLPKIKSNKLYIGALPKCPRPIRGTTSTSLLGSSYVQQWLPIPSTHVFLVESLSPASGTQGQAVGAQTSYLWEQPSTNK